MGVEEGTTIKIYNFEEDLDNFGFLTTELKGDIFDECQTIEDKEEILRFAINEANSLPGVGLLRHKMNPDDIDTVRLLLEYGFKHVDTNIAYEMDPIKEVYKELMVNSHIRIASPEDVPILEKIAGEDTYPNSRFNDIVYPRDAANKRYSSWIKEGILEGRMADVVFVYDSKISRKGVSGIISKPVGFVTGRSEDGVTEIVFIGVDKNHRKKDIGTKLCNVVLIWGVNQGDHKALVTQQGDNVAAHRCYSGLGFKMTGAKAWYHLDLRSG